MKTRKQLKEELAIELYKNGAKVKEVQLILRNNFGQALNVAKLIEIRKELYIPKKGIGIDNIIVLRIEIEFWRKNTFELLEEIKIIEKI